MNAYIYQNKKGDIKVAVTPDEQMRYDWKGWKLIEKINVKTFVEAHYGLKEKLLSNAYNCENQAGDIDFVIDVEDIRKIFSGIANAENCQCKNSTFTRRVDESFECLCGKCEELQAEVNRCYEALDAKQGING